MFFPTPNLACDSRVRVSLNPGNLPPPSPRVRRPCGGVRQGWATRPPAYTGGICKSTADPCVWVLMSVRHASSEKWVRQRTVSEHQALATHATAGTAKDVVREKPGPRFEFRGPQIIPAPPLCAGTVDPADDVHVGVAKAVRHHGHPVLRSGAATTPFKFPGFGHRRLCASRHRRCRCPSALRAPDRCWSSVVPRSAGSTSCRGSDSWPAVPGPAPQSGSNSSSGPAVRYGSVSVPDPPELFRPGALGLRATSAGAFVQ